MSLFCVGYRGQKGERGEPGIGLPGDTGPPGPSGTRLQIYFCCCYLWTNSSFSWSPCQLYTRAFPPAAGGGVRSGPAAFSRVCWLTADRRWQNAGHCTRAGEDAANSSFVLPATGLPGPPGTPGSAGPRGPPGPDGRCNPADCYYHVSQTQPRTSGK